MAGVGHMMEKKDDRGTWLVDIECNADVMEDENYVH